MGHFTGVVVIQAKGPEGDATPAGTVLVFVRRLLRETEAWYACYASCCQQQQLELAMLHGLALVLVLVRMLVAKRFKNVKGCEIR